MNAAALASTILSAILLCQSQSFVTGLPFWFVVSTPSAHPPTTRALLHLRLTAFDASDIGTVRQLIRPLLAKAEESADHAQGGGREARKTAEAGEEAWTGERVMGRRALPLLPLPPCAAAPAPRCPRNLLMLLTWVVVQELLEAPPRTTMIRIQLSNPRLTHI